MYHTFYLLGCRRYFVSSPLSFHESHVILYMCSFWCLPRRSGPLRCIPRMRNTEAANHCPSWASPAAVPAALVQLPGMCVCARGLCCTSPTYRDCFFLLSFKQLQSSDSVLFSRFTVSFERVHAMQWKCNMPSVKFFPIDCSLACSSVTSLSLCPFLPCFHVNLSNLCFFFLPSLARSSTAR